VTDPQSPSLRSARVVCIVGAAAVLAATIVVVGALTPGYSQLSETVSRLGSRGQPHAALARTGLVLYGLLIVAGAASIGSGIPGKDRLVSLLVGGYGVAGIVAGFAPKDPPNGPHSLTSQVHVASAITGGALLMCAMALVAWFAPTHAHRRDAIVGLAITGAGVVVFPFLWGTTIYGLVERVLLGAASAWLVLLALREVAPSTERRGA
jgi:hypothetical membrane protein